MVGMGNGGSSTRKSQMAANWIANGRGIVATRSDLGDDERNTDEVRYLQANSPMQTLCSQTDLDDILDAPFLRDDDVLGREIII